jgi:hypothetical protein
MINGFRDRNSLDRGSILGWRNLAPKDKEVFGVAKRIQTSNRVKIIDNASQHYGDLGIVIGEVVKKPVGMRIRNHLQVRLNNKDAVEAFLPEQLEVID